MLLAPHAEQEDDSSKEITLIVQLKLNEKFSKIFKVLVVTCIVNWKHSSKYSLPTTLSMELDDIVEFVRLGDCLQL